MKRLGVVRGWHDPVVVNQRSINLCLNAFGAITIIVITYLPIDEVNREKIIFGFSYVSTTISRLVMSHLRVSPSTAYHGIRRAAYESRYTFVHR